MTPDVGMGRREHGCTGRVKMPWTSDAPGPRVFSVLVCCPNDTGARGPVDGVSQVLGAADDGLAVDAVEVVDRGLHLGAHAAGRKMTLAKA